jgi:crotonobetainyl-CoA:carnitine CoA-transferase CaiB-like acyl-CoA transferase
MPGACSDLRILDLSREPAGAMATMVLADFGADVVRIEADDDPPDGNRLRPLLHRGKRSVAADLGTPEGRKLVRDLAAGADVVVESLGARAADRAGIGYADLSGDAPGLVYCSITGYGPEGPLADARFDDGLVMAKAGVFRDQQGWRRDGRRRPVFRAARDASFTAAMLALEGVLGALRVLEQTGNGQLVEVNLLQALTLRLNPMVRWLLRAGEQPPFGGGYDFELPAPADPEANRAAEITGLMTECKDGRWIVHMVFESNFFPSWISVLGLDWIWDDDRFKGAPRAFPDNQAREALAELLVDRMRDKNAAEWMELYVANGNVCADVVETTEEALRHPQVVGGDFLVELDDPLVGRVVEIGPLAKLPGAPAVVEAAAPRAGEHSGKVEVRRRRSVGGSSSATRAFAGPLDGITIIEVASYYATPAGMAQLADLGARVIKIEPLRGDAYRYAVRGMGHDNLVRSVQGKENVALDLKEPRGQAILHELVARADAFVHNFRLGVPERLGIDYETLRAVNPRLVYQYAASYGSTGPYRRQPAIDHMIAAMAGTTAHQAGEGNRPLKEQGADPIAASGTAVAMLLALRARDRTGESQYVESAMIVSNLYLNYEDAFVFDGKSPRPIVDHEQFGTSAIHRLYETAPVGSDHVAAPWENLDPRWVFLSIATDDEFERFCEAAGRDDLARDQRFDTREHRAGHDAQLAHVLAELFLTRRASEWERVMLAAGVGCVAADAMSQFAFFYEDPQARALGVMVEADHPVFGGKYWRHAPAVRFSLTPGVAGPYCEVGEHTRQVLHELGHDATQIAALREAGVITWPDSIEERTTLA